ncbi:MAG: cation-translocating P-type ATPase [Planctomycetota bacterium]
MSTESRRFRVSGMHCAGCAAKLARALREHPGIDDASVDLHSETALVDAQSLVTEDVASIASRLGFTVTPLPTPSALARHHDARDITGRAEIAPPAPARSSPWKRRAVIAGALWVPAGALHWLGTPMGFPHSGIAYGTAGLAAIAQVFVATGFYRSAIAAARRRTTNMDTLISLGVLAAFALSVYGLAARAIGLADPPPLYFAESIALLAIISLGHYLEARATDRAARDARRLLTLRPETVQRVIQGDPDAGTETIPAAQLSTGDRFRIPTGSRIATDAEVIEGTSAADESIITGESMPIAKATGDRLIAGSINLSGPLIAQATSDARASTLERMTELIQRAQAGGTQLQRIADRVSAIFVPAVLAVAALTLMGWGLGTGRWDNAIINATTVLVISCPCALGIATPTAVMVAVGAASRRGIILRSAAALERLGLVHTILLDKTGTITQGAPSLITPDPADPSHRDALARAAALATGSTHPLSRAITESAARAHAPHLTSERTQERPGIGITGSIVGARHTLRAARPEEPTRLDPAAAEAHPSATWSVLESSMHPPVLLGFIDPPKDDAHPAIAELNGLGISTRILSGDRPAAVEHLARAVGIDTAHAEASLTPEDKLERVRAHANQGNIAMVGDGINDTAALAAAEHAGGVAIAMDTGADLTAEHAGLVLPGASLTALPRAVRLSRAARRTIKQNLFLAFVYNTAAIPAAAFGLRGDHGPVIAAIAMGLSDLCVVGNALRLRSKLAQDQ